MCIRRMWMSSIDVGLHLLYSRLIIGPFFGKKNDAMMLDFSLGQKTFMLVKSICLNHVKTTTKVGKL